MEGFADETCSLCPLDLFMFTFFFIFKFNLVKLNGYCTSKEGE